MEHNKMITTTNSVARALQPEQDILRQILYLLPDTWRTVAKHVCREWYAQCADSVRLVAREILVTSTLMEWADWCRCPRTDLMAERIISLPNIEHKSSMLCWAVEMSMYPIPDDAIIMAIRLDQTDALEYIVRNRAIRTHVQELTCAISRNNLPALQILVEVGGYTPDLMLLTSVVKQGRLEMLRWLATKYTSTVVYYAHGIASLARLYRWYHIVEYINLLRAEHPELSGDMSASAHEMIDMYLWQQETEHRALDMTPRPRGGMATLGYIPNSSDMPMSPVWYNHNDPTVVAPTSTPRANRIWTERSDGWATEALPSDNEIPEHSGDATSSDSEASECDRTADEGGERIDGGAVRVGLSRYPHI